MNVLYWKWNNVFNWDKQFSESRVEKQVLLFHEDTLNRTRDQNFKFR